MEYSYAYIAEIVKRAQTGGSDAFAELYNCTYNKVYYYCLRYLKDEYLAQDAVQEVYISAFKNTEKLNDPTLFIAWLNQIAFHVCYDMMRKRKSDYGEVDNEILEQILDTHPDSNLEERIVEADDKARLQAAISKLTVTEQQIITLRYFNGMKIDEIVKATGISRSTVKRQLISITEKLRKIMKE